MGMFEFAPIGKTKEANQLEPLTNLDQIGDNDKLSKLGDRLTKMNVEDPAALEKYSLISMEYIKANMDSLLERLGKMSKEELEGFTKIMNAMGNVLGNKPNRNPLPLYDTVFQIQQKIFELKVAAMARAKSEPIKPLF